MPTHDYPYKNLVFEDGGVKGVAYGGVFEVLEQRLITPQIEPTLIGAETSAEACQGAEQLNVSRLGIRGTIVIIDTFRSGA